MTDHAAAVEGVRVRHRRDEISAVRNGTEQWSQRARDAHADRATLLRAYEDAALTRDQLSDALSVRDHELTTLRAQHAALVKALDEIEDVRFAHGPLPDHCAALWVKVGAILRLAKKGGP
jgi:hypothetical protein